MVPPVADVNGDATESGFEDGVSGVALHVVRGLIEVAHAGDVVLEQACRGCGSGAGMQGMRLWSRHAGVCGSGAGMQVCVVMEQARDGVGVAGGRGGHAGRGVREAGAKQRGAE